tara:strand:- start:54 stop:1562 length:1509 start_codon:yes stop_codon:yes gene_type:complete
MAFPAQTDHKESLQALAFAMRQNKGSDITAGELRLQMVEMTMLDSSIRNSCEIDYNKMRNDFYNWVDMADTPKDVAFVDGWIDSCVWTANAVIANSHIKGSGYTFYQSGSLPDFRGAFKEIAKRIKSNASNGKVRSIYSLMAKGTGDKWNPADVLAIKSSKASNVLNTMSSFKNGNPPTNLFSELKTLQDKNKDLEKAFSGSEKKNLRVVEDMNELYYYNQYIDDLYKSGDGVPISLKKVESSGRLEEVQSPNVRIVSFDHKETKGIEDAINLELEIEDVEYRVDTGKCIVNFALGGQTGHFMDIRSTATKIRDVQMQLQFGTSANHGKATLPVFSLITHLTKGHKAISAQTRKKKQLFPRKRFPSARTHSFTRWEVFDDYASNRSGEFSNETLIVDVHNWARYIEWLSNRRNNQDVVMRAYRNKLGSRNNYQAAAKYLKNKVQSYEVGMVLDQDRAEINDVMKTNIMKAVYSQAASKGFRIFSDDSITDYMSSSSYLKVGG